MTEERSRNPDGTFSESHGGYSLMKAARDHGTLPSAKTREGKAIRAIEAKIWEHFGNDLNPLQQILVSMTLIPISLYLLVAPIHDEEFKMTGDYQWASNKLSNCLKELNALQGTEVKAGEIDLKDYVKQIKQDRLGSDEETK